MIGEIILNVIFFTAGLFAGILLGINTEEN